MRKTLLVLLLFTAFFPVMGAAATGTAPLPPGVNWLSEVTDQVNALVTNYSDELVDLGTTELAFFAIFTLVGIVVRWQLSHMVIGFRPVNYTIGDLLAFFLNLVACSLLLHYYNAPFQAPAFPFTRSFQPSPKQ
jgi:hypothetical protein